MKALVISSFVALAAVLWAQMTITDTVITAIDRQLDPDLISGQAGVATDVEILHRQDGLLDSSGSVRLTSHGSNGLSMEIDYQVSHSLLAFLSGVSYQGTIDGIKVRLDGSEVHVNDAIWDGKKIGFSGLVTDAGTAGGIVSIPAVNSLFDVGPDVWGSPQYLDVSVPAFDIHVDMQGINQPKSQYSVSTSFDDVVVKSAGDVLTIGGIDYQQSTERSSSGLDSDVTFAIASLGSASVNPMQDIQMTDIRIATDLDLRQQLSYRSKLSIGNVRSQIGEARDFFLNSRLTGIDGQSLRDVVSLLEQTGGMDGELQSRAVMLYMQQHFDAMLAPGPVLALESGVQFNGENFYDVDAEAHLQTDQLPRDFFATWMAKGNAADMKTLLSAVMARVNARLSPGVAMMVAGIHPLIAEKAFKGEELKFVVRDGLISLNDQALF